MKRWRRLPGALVVCAAMGLAQTPEAGKSNLPPIDASKIARRVVAGLRPTPGERAILAYDPAYYPELKRAMEGELRRAGVESVLAITFDAPELAAPTADPASARRREEEIVSWLRPVFAKADIFLWLPGRALAQDLRWERLLESSHARGIHFHWIYPLEGKSSEEIASLSRMYERAILETDYAALSAEQDRLIAALCGTALRITTPDGTDLRMRIPADAWFHKNDGDMSPARARQGRSARDREMEFPAGALRFIPDVGTVEGRLVLRRVATPGGVAEGVTLEFSGGRAVRWQAEKNEKAVLALREAIGGDIDKVGEIVLGTNPLLVAAMPSGELPYFGYGAGYLRVSLGDNWESGGANRSPGGRPLWLFLEHATVEAGGRVLLRDGRIVK